MKRPLTVLAAVLMLFATVLGSAEEVQAQSGFVTWTVDHRAKTITVRVKLAVYDRGCPPTEGGGGTGGGCSTPIDRVVKELRTDMEATWNGAGQGGRFYRCYRLVIVVDITVVGNRDAVPGDRFGVGIDRSTQGFRSRVQITPASENDNYLSNEPADRGEPTNGNLRPSMFGYPPMGRHDYAHELGHILGLDDYYDEATQARRPGAPDDMMFDQNSRTISKETIDRLVERNRDRLRDRQGRPVGLDQLVCDLRYKATLTATDTDYTASNLRHQLSGPGCDPPTVITVSTSTQQSMEVRSEPVVLYVLDAPSVPFLEYSLAALPDVLRGLWGLSERFLQVPTETAFAMPVTIRVSRDTHSPARGEKPPLLTTEPEACSEEEGRGPPPSDCGTRSFKAWMALLQQGLDELFTGDAPVPLHLADLGRSPARQQLLYQNCPGPDPWPGSFVSEGEATVFRGKLPVKGEIERVARDWAAERKPGRIVIRGTARLSTVETGFLRNRSYTWTLTLCPMDRAGETPPLCP